MNQIRVNNILIDVVRKDIKNLHLAVYPPTGRVRIASPLKIDDESVRLFAVSKLSWIKKHIINFANQERQSAREYISGESHYYSGRRYLLNVIYQKYSSKVKIRNKKYIDLYVRENSNREQRKKVLVDWYRKQLKEKIPVLIQKWESIIGIEVHDWGVRLMKRKWGSCNISDKRIWLNLELSKKPEHCLEYIIVHEMVHFLERKHNEHYISILDKYMPKWRFYKEKLNRFIL